MSTDRPAVGGRTGRPRDGSADAQILALTLEALAERDYDQVTLDSIAARSGRAKTTLYRRWPTKSALVLAAVQSAGPPPEVHRLPDEGSLRADLLAVIDSPWLGGPERRGAIFTGLSSAARSSPEIADAIQDQITDAYVRLYHALLQRAVDRGLLPQAVRHQIALVAHVIPAMSSDRLNERDEPAGRDYYIAVVDDIVLPALMYSGGLR